MSKIHSTFCSQKKVLSSRLTLLCLSLCCVFTTVSSLPAAQTQVIDAAGRRVQVPHPVHRLVTTFKPATLCVLSLGLSDTLVGLDSSSRRDPLTMAVAPKLATVPGVGSKSRGINLETVMSLEPDLVILFSQKSGIHLANRLRDSGFSTLVIKPETFDSIRKTLRILAAAAGIPQQASKVIKAMHRVQTLTQNRVQDIVPAQRKKVYYAGPIGFLSTAPSGMLQDMIIHRAGGRNVASHLQGYFQRISPEQLMSWAPQSIVLCRMIRPQAKVMLTKPEYSLMPAIQSASVHVFPSTLVPWDFPSPLSALGVLWLGARLYPDRFADIDLMHEVDSFHQTLFGRSFRQMDGHLDDGLPGKEPVRSHAHSQNQPNMSSKDHRE